MLIYGVVLLVLIRYRPQGLVGDRMTSPIRENRRMEELPQSTASIWRRGKASSSA